MKVRLAVAANLLVVLSVSHAGNPPLPNAHPAGSDPNLLAELFREQDYHPGRTFKALLIEIVEGKSGTFAYYPHDYRGTSTHTEWWPASTVKLYAAVAALERLHDMGFTPEAQLTFQYEDKPVVQKMSRLIERAIVYSKNPEYDRLVEFVGCDWINQNFLNERNGLPNTVLLRAYFRRVRYPKSGKGSNRHSPSIRIEQGCREKTLPERMSTANYACPDDGNCTTLTELAEAMRRVMMHESLPARERYGYSREGLALLREALGRNFKRGGIFEAIEAAYGDRKVTIHHKPGYADGWFSDNLFVHIEEAGERWIVVMANRYGRDSCNEPAAMIAEWMATGEITRRRTAKQTPPSPTSTRNP